MPPTMNQKENENEYFGCFKLTNHFFPSFVAETASIIIEIKHSPAVFNKAIQSIFSVLSCRFC
jgi:hypothetical protein